MRWLLKWCPVTWRLHDEIVPWAKWRLLRVHVSTESPRIMVAGSQGMVGSAIVRRLSGEAEVIEVHRGTCDLTDATATQAIFDSVRPDHVYLAAARVGGIVANNTAPVDFLLDNLRIQNNVISAAHAVGVQRLMFLGSSCIYPREAEQPMREDALLTGTLEPTNEPYAIAKIAGIKLCESYNRQYGTDYRSAMPTNLYGPGDNFDLENSHVIPALIRKFVDAVDAADDEVEIWGSGRPRREFLHVDDMADACVFLMGLSGQDYWSVAQTRLSHINVGYGEDVTIAELARLIAGLSGFDGAVRFDTSRPDGAPRKLMDSTQLFSLGWRPRMALKAGLQSTLSWYSDKQTKLRKGQ
ncbi:GDP-L-fucose synthase [bacterium]|nr:GDP-L-fucose synthase [bacterium]